MNDKKNIQQEIAPLTASEEENKPLPLDQLIKLAKSIVENGKEADEWMNFSSFMNQIYTKENAFTPKNYESNLRPITFFKELQVGGKKVFALDRKNNFDVIKNA